MTPKYSIIIVNYNSISEINNCIRSITEHHIIPNFEITVVSNSETKQNDIDNFKSHKLPVSWIETGSNIGFGAACNIGAENSSGDYLFFLNPDTFFLNDVLTILESDLQQNTNVVIAGPATYDSNMKNVSSVKNDLSFLWLLNWIFPFFGYFNRKATTFRDINTDKPQTVNIINGSALFIRKKDFLSIGGFSKDYFMYWEENDLCKRVRESGSSVLFSPHAKVVHTGGHSTKKSFFRMEIEKHRSQKKYMKKHHPFLCKLNRISGIMAYLLRTLYSTLFFKRDKTKQFRILLKWYIFVYK